jgi:hypothetical protein
MFQEIERFSEYHLNCTLGARLDIRFAENKNILDRYPNQIEPIVPSVVFLAKSDKILKERKCLEELVSHVPETKQKNWINHISSEDEVSYLSSWFKMMLYGWLRQLGDVEIEPEINGKRPDFCAII